MGLDRVDTENIVDEAVDQTKLAATTTQTITGNDAITHGDKRSVLLTINNDGDNTCTIADGSVVGQELTLIIDTIVATSEIIIASSAPNTKLFGQWYRPLAGCTLSMRWDGTNWREFGRGEVQDGSNEHINSGRFAQALGGAKNTNSAEQSASVGGYSNNNTATYCASLASHTMTNSASHAASVGGEGGSNSGQYSASLGGINSKAELWSQHVHSAGKFATAGDAQRTRLVARRVVTHDASPGGWYDLFLDGTDDLIVIPTDSVWTFSILISGTTQGCTKSFAFKIEGIIENDGGTTTVLASTVTTIYDTDDTDFDAQVVADDANDALVIQVQDTTDGGDTVRWMASIDAVCVTFPA